MKRQDIVKRLIKEGFSETTLVSLNDKQLSLLSDRILAEQAPMSDSLGIPNVSKTDLSTQSELKRDKKPFSTYEGEIKEEDKEEKKWFQTKDEDKKEEKKGDSNYVKKLKHKIANLKDKDKVDKFKRILAALENKKTEPKEVSSNEFIEQEEKPKFKSKTEWLKSKGIIKDDGKKEETKEQSDIDDLTDTSVTMNEQTVYKLTNSSIGEMHIMSKRPGYGKGTSKDLKEAKSIALSTATKNYRNSIGKPEIPVMIKDKKIWRDKSGLYIYCVNVEAKGGERLSTLNEWVDNIVSKNVHPFTSKNDIMNLITDKLNEQNVAEPEVKKGVPNFLTYDDIKNAGDDREVEVAEPIVKPGTRPTTTPNPKKPLDPYKPGRGINPAPKAMRKKVNKFA